MSSVGMIVKTPSGEGIIKIIEGASDNRRLWTKLKVGAQENYKYIELDDYREHGLHTLNIFNEEDCLGLNSNNDIHWEMAAIQEGGSTISQGTYDNIKDALKALSENDDETSFIDNWRDTFQLWQTIRKDDISEFRLNHPI